MISMVIPCYFANKELFKMSINCFGSLNDTTDQMPEEVIVVDDGSPLGIELVDETDFVQQFRVITRKKNGGYAAAVNTGLFYTKGDVLVISNNDIIFTPGWLEAILKPLNEGYDISSIRTSDQTWETDNYISEGDKFGSLWAMKRKVYETIGGLDESFGNYFEDLDYQVRAEAAGFKVGKNHGHLVEHLGKATFKTVDPEDKQYLAAMEKFRKKHGKVF